MLLILASALCPPVLDWTSHQSVTLAPNEPITLRLPCPHGEPCRWELFGRDGTVVAQDRLADWIEVDGERVQTFRLRSVAPGSTRITAVHAQGNGPVLAVVSVDVFVTTNDDPID